jgi:hypothetical protein
MGRTVAGESFHFLITSLQQEHATNNGHVPSERTLKPCKLRSHRSTGKCCVRRGGVNAPRASCNPARSEKELAGAALLLLLLQLQLQTYSWRQMDE